LLETYWFLSTSDLWTLLMASICYATLREVRCLRRLHHFLFCYWESRQFKSGTWCIETSQNQELFGNLGSTSNIKVKGAYSFRFIFEVEPKLPNNDDDKFDENKDVMMKLISQSAYKCISKA
jgi:hypothetical protein